MAIRSMEDATTPNVAKNAPKVNIPTRMTPKANPEEDRRKDLNEQLRLLAEENKKKAESMKDEDMDGFWSKLKNKLGKK